MANRNALIRQLVRLGITYGPIAYQGLLKNKGAVQEFSRRQMHQRNHRAMAFEHAESLIDGSVLPVFDGDTRVYVVFSGSAPIATHPVVRTPMDKLIMHYDMSRRMRRDQAGPAPDSPSVSHHIPPTSDRGGMWKERLAGRRRPLRRRSVTQDSPASPASSETARGDLPPISDLPTVRRNASWPGDSPRD